MDLQTVISCKFKSQILTNNLQMFQHMQLWLILSAIKSISLRKLTCFICFFRNVRETFAGYKNGGKNVSCQEKLLVTGKKLFLKFDTALKKCMQVNQDHLKSLTFKITFDFGAFFYLTWNRQQQQQKKTKLKSAVTQQTGDMIR